MIPVPPLVADCPVHTYFFCLLHESLQWYWCIRSKSSLSKMVWTISDLCISERIPFSPLRSYSFLLIYNIYSFILTVASRSRLYLQVNVLFTCSLVVVEGLRLYRLSLLIAHCNILQIVTIAGTEAFRGSQHILSSYLLWRIYRHRYIEQLLVHLSTPYPPHVCTYL